MKISAVVKNRFEHHEVIVQTDESAKQVSIAPRSTGFGSSINGGELLMLSLATCFCNDIYREAAIRNIVVSGVEVIVSGEFGTAGEPGTGFSYKAVVNSDAPAAEIDALIKHTDKVAEIQNTLRKGIDIVLES